MFLSRYQYQLASDTIPSIVQIWLLTPVAIADVDVVQVNYYLMLSAEPIIDDITANNVVRDSIIP